MDKYIATAHMTNTSGIGIKDIVRDGVEEYVLFDFIGGMKDYDHHKRKLYITNKGRIYFIFGYRQYLDDFLCV
jgi:hypothetical protein